ncbi:MAG: Polyketide cyclase / dehydrase and lipid transport [Acidobacteria bacterium ADurb.Bin340]|nr:MAG: Polyketide cyclase / dehydrase and lipid transport [Acidobacteria bacterium ADurb.Bin340]
MKEERFVATQDVPASREAVFAFFSDPSNLQALTPPWLAFEILTPAPLPVGEGAVYDYRIRFRGLSLRWRTLIEVWEPGRRFVDRQIQGPYALWHHTHRFEDLPDGGTRHTDQVRWRVGFGPLGRLMAPLVKRDIERIFTYRREVIGKRMGSFP